MTKYTFSRIDYNDAVNFLLPRHYSGRIPSVSYAFGVFEKESKRLMAVCTFGLPASPALCVGLAGKEYKNNVLELNRLCREDDYKEPLSQFVSWCLRQLKDKNVFVVSYSDMAMQHHGYIYQACNFLFTGQTKQRTDKYTSDGKHSRHYNNDEQGEYRKVRTAKNRYVCFCTYDKRLRQAWEKALKYPILAYPKEQNKNYILGEYQKDILVKAN